MLIRHQSGLLLMGLAVTASLFGCARTPNGVTDAAAASAQAVGAKLAAQDRADALRHRSAIARLMRVDYLTVRETDRTIAISFTAHNLSRKAVTRDDLAFESDAPDGTRIATAELHANVPIPANATKRVTLVVPYVQFGSDTGPMREAMGKPQRYALDVKEIKYADGSDAGYDD